MLVSDSGQDQPLSPDTGDLLIRSTRLNLRIQRHGPGPVHLHTEAPTAPRQIHLHTEAPTAPRQIHLHTEAPAAPPRQIHLHTEAPTAPRQIHLHTEAPTAPRQIHLHTEAPAAPPRQIHLHTEAPTAPRQIHLHTEAPTAPRQIHLHTEAPTAPRQIHLHTEAPAAPKKIHLHTEAPAAPRQIHLHTEAPAAPKKIHLHTEAPAAPRPSRTPPPPGEEELQTIRLAAGGRGAGLEALRQRSQSAPRRRPVKVMLLDSRDGPGQDSSSHNAPGQDCNMERVSELTESVQKLLQNHRGQTLTEETLHRLETLHNQQLTLQEAGLRPERVLMEMERLRAELRAELQAALTQREEPEKPPPGPRPSRTFQNPPRSSRVPVTRLHTRSETRAQTLPRSTRKDIRKHDDQRETLGRQPSTEETTPRDEETTPRDEETTPRDEETTPRDEETTPREEETTPSTEETTPSTEETTQKQQLNVCENQESESEEQENYIQYLQNRIESKQHDPRVSGKHREESKSRRAGGEMEKRREEEKEKRGETLGKERLKERLKERPAALRSDALRSDALRSDALRSAALRSAALRSAALRSAALRSDVLGSDALRSDALRSDALRSAALRSDALRSDVLGSDALRSAALRSDVLGSDALRSAALRSDALRSAALRSAALRSDLLAGPEAPRSALDEARLVLRKVQRQRKVLEENLESQLRARSAELLHCRLDALRENRDCSAEIRMKKAVDSFIRDIQAETETESAATKASANRKAAAGRRNPAPQTNRKNPTSSANRSAAERRNPAPSGTPLRTDAKATAVDPEERLRRLYGKAAHDGQRRSLKRSPYLRLSSPVSPDRSRPRPRLLQSVRGVKLKSCKTQTPAPGPGFSPGLDLSPGSVRSGDVFPAVAVPLGRPRTGPAHRVQQEVTSPPRAPPPPSPLQEVTSAPTPPKEESRAEPQEQSSDPPPVVTIQTSPHLQEEEEAEFPGTHFLSVADVEQSEAGSDAPGGSEEPLQLEGGPDPDLVQYQGPQFPPRPRAPSLPSAQEQSLDLGLGLQQDALEQRLVQWVEQQLMSRIICDMSRPALSDPTHSPYTGQSEPVCPSGLGDPGLSGLSGLSRLQLQVDSGLDLDEEQVRELVLEVLTEIVALFLGSRESPDPQTGPGPGPGPDPGPGPGPDPGAETGPDAQSLTQTQQILVPTPEATPPQTPPPAAQTPPLSPVATPRATPPPSAPPSVKEDPPPEPVATPPATPPEPSLVQAEEEEEPEAPPPPEPSPAPAAVAPPPGPPSPPDASPSSSSSDSGTSVTAPRHISEGELLLSQRHLQALHEENSSFSSSLHELQEMELDPPSEGQVHGRSILLSFINKLQQREPRPPPEGAWGRGLEEEEEVSAGEIKDVVTESAANHSRSPGQASPVTGEAFERTNHSALSEGLLTSDLLDTPLAQDDAPKRSDLGFSQEPPQTPDQGVGGAEGGVWADGGPAPLMVDVFVPSAETAETSGGSDSFSDAF